MPTDGPTGAQAMFGDFAPQLVHLTDDVLSGQVWPDEGLSRRRPGQFMTHLALWEGEEPTWLEHVGDAEHGAARAGTGR
uniref:hypothetical protein n=1 Tax=Nonomuraea bangladeshensis TaxID=404385 RepID=UPI003F4972A8